MSLVILVVILIYTIYMDMKPELSRDMPMLWLTSGVFAVMGAAAWTAAWAYWKEKKALWAFEAGFAASFIICIMVLIAAYT